MLIYKGPPCIVEIHEKQTLWQIDKSLKEKKVIPFRGFAFICFCISPKKIVPGEYKIEMGDSYISILKKILHRQRLFYKLTIPEGLESYKIINRIYGAPKLVGSIDRLPEEGSCFPATYYYYKGTTRKEIVEQMKKQMEKVKSNISSSFLTPEQIIVLASIIQKEADTIEEMPVISSVYINRLRRNMILQADPTVAYGLTHGIYNRILTRSDLKAKTPYNTYINQGLPPKPICSPGKAAIEAAIHPANTSYIYFVARGTKGHWFTEDYQNHLKCVKKYKEQIKP